MADLSRTPRIIIEPICPFCHCTQLVPAGGRLWEGQGVLHAPILYDLVRCTDCGEDLYLLRTQRERWA